jgi:hypothetical protein
MTATGYIHYALDKKQNIPLVFGAEPDLMENTLKFVQYQKNIDCIVGIYSIRLGLKQVFNYDKRTTHLLI